ncbi:uncharacterized protein ACIBXB_011822 isoform 2-T2 [Morphnus guianensis]
MIWKKPCGHPLSPPAARATRLPVTTATAKRGRKSHRSPFPRPYSWPPSHRQALRGDPRGKLVWDPGWHRTPAWIPAGGDAAALPGAEADGTWQHLCEAAGLQLGGAGRASSKVWGDWMEPGIPRAGPRPSPALFPQRRSGTKGTGSSSASEAWKPHCSCSRSPDRNNIPAHASRICCPDARPRVGWDRILQLDPGPFLANRTACHGPAALPALPVPQPCMPSLPARSSVDIPARLPACFCQTLPVPCLTWGTPHPLDTSFLRILRSCFPGAGGGVLAPSPAASPAPALLLSAASCLGKDDAAGVSRADHLHPAGTETSTAVSSLGSTDPSCKPHMTDPPGRHTGSRRPGMLEQESPTQCSALPGTGAGGRHGGTACAEAAGQPPCWTQPCRCREGAQRLADPCVEPLLHGATPAPWDGEETMLLSAGKPSRWEIQEGFEETSQPLAEASKIAFVFNWRENSPDRPICWRVWWRARQPRGCRKWVRELQTPWGSCCVS